MNQSEIGTQFQDYSPYDGRVLPLMGIDKYYLNRQKLCFSRITNLMLFKWPNFNTHDIRTAVVVVGGAVK